MKKNALKGYFLSVLMALIIGLQFSLLKKLLEKFEGVELGLLFVRFLIALCCCLISFLIKKAIEKCKSKNKGFETDTPQNDEDTASKLKHGTGKIKTGHLFDKRIIGLCLITPFINLLFQTYGAEYSKIGIIGYVTGLGPITALLTDNLINKRKTEKKQLIFICLCVLGSFLAARGSFEMKKGAVLGVLLTLGALITRSLYASLSQKNPDKPSALNMTLCQMFWGTALFGLSAALFKQLSGLTILILELNGLEILCLIYLSVMSLFVLYLINNSSLGKIGAVSVGVINNLTFIVILATGVLFETEKITFASAAGAALIAIGVILSEKCAQKNRTEKNPARGNPNKGV